jgi:hypothetical protein
MYAFIDNREVTIDGLMQYVRRWFPTGVSTVWKGRSAMHESWPEVVRGKLQMILNQAAGSRSLLRRCLTG